VWIIQAKLVKQAEQVGHQRLAHRPLAGVQWRRLAMTGQVDQYQVSLRCKSANYRIPRLPSMAEAVQENQRWPSPNTLVNQPHTSCFTPQITIRNSSIRGGVVLE